MLLSARLLLDVQSVNSFKSTQQIQFTEGDTPTIYFQLIDSNLDTSLDGYNPPGRRYMPASGATLSVKLNALDTAKTVTRTATKPFTQDSSIWAVSLLTTDVIKGTIQLNLTLNESGVVTNGVVKNAILIWPKGN